MVARGSVYEAADASPGGLHETVTLRMETATPRKRSLVSTFKRVRTPPSESQPARRQRKKNEGKARARAACRLDAADHERYKETERMRKRAAARASDWAAPTIWQLPCMQEQSVAAAVHQNAPKRRDEAEIDVWRFLT